MPALQGSQTIQGNGSISLPAFEPEQTSVLDPFIRMMDGDVRASDIMGRSKLKWLQGSEIDTETRNKAVGILQTLVELSRIKQFLSLFSKTAESLSQALAFVLPRIEHQDWTDIYHQYNEEKKKVSYAPQSEDSFYLPDAFKFPAITLELTQRQQPTRVVFRQVRRPELSTLFSETHLAEAEQYFADREASSNNVLFLSAQLLTGKVVGFAKNYIITGGAKPVVISDRYEKFDRSKENEVKGIGFGYFLYILAILDQFKVFDNTTKRRVIDNVLTSLINSFEFYGKIANKPVFHPIIDCPDHITDDTAQQIFKNAFLDYKPIVIPDPINPMGYPANLDISNGIPYLEAAAMGPLYQLNAGAFATFVR